MCGSQTQSARTGTTQTRTEGDLFSGCQLASSSHPCQLLIVTVTDTWKNQNSAFPTDAQQVSSVVTGASPIHIWT